MKLLPVCIAMLVISPTVTNGRWCYTCKDAANNAECNQQGMKECPINENWCQTEIRIRRDVAGTPKILIKKGCKQETACKNNQRQNNKTEWEPAQCDHDGNALLSVCRYCCGDKEKGCNEGLPDHDCGTIVPPRFTQYLCQPDNRYYTSKCSLQCLPGFTQPGEQLQVDMQCMKNGSWTPPDVDAGRSIACIWDGTSTTGYPFCDLFAPPRFGGANCSDKCSLGSCDIAAHCELFCDDGYQAQGPSTTTCGQPDELDDAQWLPSTQGFTCTAIQCPVMTRPDWGNVTCYGESGPSSFGAICFLNCSAGFALNGSDTRTCLADGTWSGVEVTCQKDTNSTTLIKCDDIPSPENGSASCYEVADAYEYNYFCVLECDPGHELVGPSFSLCLPDGSWSESNATCSAVTCPSLDISNFADVKCNGPGGNYSYGSVCEFNCTRGWRLTGSKSRTCQENGSWSGQSSGCEVVLCPTLSNLANGTWHCIGEYGNFSYGSECVAICDPGYKVAGDERATCQHNKSWSQKYTVCQPKNVFIYSHYTKPVTCPSLDSPRFGETACIATSTNSIVGSVCEFNCSNGWILSGSHSRTCLQNGTWSGQNTSCDFVQCPAFVNLNNGTWNCIGKYGNFSFGTECTAICNPGYKMVGNGRKTCQHNGSWSDLGSFCQKIDCPSLNNPLYGTIRCNMSSYRGVCETVCQSGFKLQGPQFRTCRENGTWSDVEALCKVIQCPAFQSLINGTWNCVGKYGNFSFGSECTAICKPGYKLVGNGRKTCEPNGSWSGMGSFCEKIDCPSLNNPLYGTIRCNTRSYGGVCETVCQSGFGLQGPQFRTCRENGTWSETEAFCEAFECPALKPPNNGYMDCVGAHGPFSQSATCTFSCESGYELLGSNQRTCSNNGSWSGVQTVCQVIQCSPVGNISNGNFNCSGDLGLYAYSSHCTLECHDGYEVDGLSLFTCQSNGSWSGEGAVCKPIFCGSLSSLLNGKMECHRSDAYYGNVCVATCDVGFRLSGSKVRECLANRTWSGERALCKVTTCTQLSSPLNGALECLGEQGPWTTNAICRFTCDLGYNLVGSKERRCLANSTWSGMVSTCQPVECPVLQNPAWGVTKCSGLYGSNFYSSECDTICDDGFILVGSKLRVCQGSGIWSGKQSNCAVVKCPLLGDLQLGETTCSGLHGANSYGSECETSCSTGSFLDGSKLRLCQANGTWSGSRATCAAVTCPPLTAPPLTEMKCNKTQEALSFGDICTFTCPAVFNLVGSRQRECTENGSWTGQDAVCQIKTCPPPTIPLRASVECFSDRGPHAIGANCTVNCSAGYFLLGNAFRECQDNQTWTDESGTCKAKPCLALSTPLYGAKNCNNSEHDSTFGSVCSFRCAEGFDLRGSPLRACLVNGSWSGQDTLCEPVECPPLANVSNGSFKCSGASSRSMYPSLCILTCDVGYRVLGVGETICQSNGTWSGGENHCRPVECPLLSDPSLGETVCSGPDGVHSYKSECFTSCSTGSKLSGSDFRVCQSNGSWSGIDANCSAVVCPPLRNPSLGKTECATVASEWQPYGSECLTTCSEGSTLRGSTLRACQANGSWTGEESDCIVINCSRLANPLYGSTICTNESLYGSTCNFTCQAGYVISGSETRVCLRNATWSGTKAKCAVLTCPALNPPLNGNMECLGTDGISAYGSTCLFSCDPGFELLGSSSRTCQDNGNWSGMLAICQEWQCPKLTPPDNGDIVCDQNLSWQSECRYRCNGNHFLVGPGLRVCQANRTWSDVAPVCRPVTCPKLSDPNNGYVECTGMEDADGNFRVSSECTVRCHAGYNADPLESRKCRSNGSWSGVVHQCLATLCNAVKPPANGAVECVSTSQRYLGVNTTCYFACQDGYKLQGDATTVCTEDGRWSSVGPNCTEETKCQIVSSLVNGHVTCSMPPDRLYAQSTCSFYCNMGYQLQGRSMLSCMADGNWSHGIPHCNSDCSWYWSEWDNCDNKPINTRSRSTIATFPHNDCNFTVVTQKEACCQHDYLHDTDLDICYKFHCDSLDWKNAVQTCRMESGNLVKVTSYKQHEFLRTFMRRKNLGPYWIGLTDVVQESVFRWSDGSLLGSYQQWFQRIDGNAQPDNYRNREHCVKMTPGWKAIGMKTSDYDWNDSNCVSSGQYLCQIPCNGTYFKYRQLK